jgi:hypothetical protein
MYDIYDIISARFHSDTVACASVFSCFTRSGRDGDSCVHVGRSSTDLTSKGKS